MTPGEIFYRHDMGIELIHHVGDDETVARAARVSTGKDQIEQGKTDGLIRYLVQSDPPHSSVLEHCIVTIRAEVPIFVHRQLMTHRTLSKNSESGRYTEFEPVFYVPDRFRPVINKGTSARPELALGKVIHRYAEQQEHMQIAQEGWASYQKSLARGTAKEVARNYIPVTAYTSIWMTGNLLAWFNFLNLRNGDKGHPQYEIVEVAQKVEKIIEELYPKTYTAWKER